MDKGLSSVLFSVRMRATMKIGNNGEELHLSGCERLVTENQVLEVVQNLLKRAEEHTRGRADMVNIQIEKIDKSNVRIVPALTVQSREFPNVSQAHADAIAFLIETGVSETAARKGLEAIEQLKTSMRGAMIYDAASGNRLDRLDMRGVRLSHMDCKDKNACLEFLKRNNMKSTKLSEALVLASKAASVENYVAELCWSDDPNYTTGYVASKKFYRRLSPMKHLESPIGGRVFFFKPNVDIKATIDFFEKEPALVDIK
ncbi:MAG: 6-carboxyhexanoate--CoA ligase [Puniceicoccales bacterium]|jgi:6-carboxyhexanoate--CoA ligase|nr:6-carboxyhexanoate--CoA ligase [Puniceicoccales bacterium]